MSPLASPEEIKYHNDREKATVTSDSNTPGPRSPVFAVVQESEEPKSEATLSEGHSADHRAEVTFRSLGGVWT